MNDSSNKKEASVVTKANVPKKKPPNKKGRIIIRNLSFKVNQLILVYATFTYVLKFIIRQQKKLLKTGLRSMEKLRM